MKNHGERKIQDVTVEMAINGARAIKSMVTETSDLDANMGPVAAVGHLGWPFGLGKPRELGEETVETWWKNAENDGKLRENCKNYGKMTGHGGTMRF